MGIKNFTPLHNDKILLDVIAKGRLNKSELRISAWVWRYSWGFNDKKKNRRQDWTKTTTQREIAKEIEMDEAVVSKNINQMVKANILLEKGNRYQFNEHQETWNLTNRQLDKSSSLTNGQVRLDKRSSKLDKRSSFSSVSSKNNEGLYDPKKTLKKTKIKKLKHSCEPNRFTPSQFIQWWNENKPENLKKCLRLPPKKTFLAHIKTRLAEHPSRAEWDEIMDKIKASPFLLGENRTGWQVSIDFLVANPDNIMKILEGKYDKKEDEIEYY